MLNVQILQIKEKLKEIKGFEVEGQKIVMKGKATQNEDTVEKLNIKDKDFLVVMTTIKVMITLKVRNHKARSNRLQRWNKKYNKNQR